jgi:hypothetical protein
MAGISVSKSIARDNLVLIDIYKVCDVVDQVIIPMTSS